MFKFEGHDVLNKLDVQVIYQTEDKYPLAKEFWTRVAIQLCRMQVLPTTLEIYVYQDPYERVVFKSGKILASDMATFRQQWNRQFPNRPKVDEVLERKRDKICYLQHVIDKLQARIDKVESLQVEREALL